MAAQHLQVNARLGANTVVVGLMRPDDFAVLAGNDDGRQYGFAVVTQHLHAHRQAVSMGYA